MSARPALGGTVKIGKPYQVFGVWYYPSDDRAYDEKGVASWYGPGFHALNTANGERYNQDDLTAAHKTLPMPSWVEVENIDNGRRLTVRVNDRGPFVAGRIIDLSRASAQLLGVDRPGTARVRVRRVFPDGAQAMVMAPAVAAAPSLPVAMPVPPTVAATAAVPPVITVALPASVTSATLPAAAPVAPGAIFVQVAALSDPGRIAWLKGYLSVFGPVVTETAPSGLTRVRLGPYSDAASAGAALAQLRRAGYNDARLIPAGGAAPKP
ncbi:septal ring lytic transglycosylase RlpA family protein [Sandarakinorhabdus sp.]|uniref:septal ring lytic transglycosylase RlpA family protein n=1 Tax=Sandarakinorhabdus sp. TaxID=1916663 RepID=UPI00286E6B6E|nr:septal ring lytic transglycosylase RlpA family protein [Sandarakinorhabdus sp.]